MVFAFATFGLVLGIILGVYWLLVVRPEQRQVGGLARIGGPPPPPKSGGSAESAATPERDAIARQRPGARRRTGGAAQPHHRSIGAEGDARHHSAGVGVEAAARLLLVTPSCISRWSRRSSRPWRRVFRSDTCATRGANDCSIRGTVPRGDRSPVAPAAGHALTTGLSMVAEELRIPSGRNFRPYDQQNLGCHRRR